MRRRTKTVIATVAGVAVLATGGVAVAAATDTTAGQGHRASGSRHHDDIEHGQFVTRDAKTGQQVTVDVVNGTVTAVSSSSIAVKAGDGTTLTFRVVADTRVEQRGSATSGGSSAGGTGRHHHPTTSTIGAIHTGETVHVMGTGTGTFTAMRVVAD